MKNQFNLAVILFFALLVALYLGTTVASGDIIALSGWTGVTFLLFFLVKGYQFAWQAILFVAWGNISFMTSFRIEPIHAASFLFVLFVLSSIIRGARLLVIPNLKPAGVFPLNITMLAFLIYGGVHLVICRIFPHIAGEFNLGNSAKAYFKAYAPLAILLFGLNSSIGFQVRKGWSKYFLYLMAFAVFGNVSYLAYLYINGFSAASQEAGFEEIGIVHIPIINAVPHHFAMRTLGPLAVLFGFGIATIPGWWRSQSIWVKLALLTVIIGGLGGALLSGGRAAVAMCLFFTGIIAFYRKRIILIFCAGMGAMVLVALANLFSEYINKEAPMFVARPLQYLMVEKGDAMDTINHSQDQRGALFSAAIEEWQSDSRVLLIGRGVYRYTNTWNELRKILGEEGAFVEVNLRAGTCHALIPSALIQYGVFGFLLYLIFWMFILRFNWKLYRLLRREGYSDQLQTLTACLLVYQCLRLVIDLVASGWFTIFTVTMLMLIRSRMAYELAEKAQEEKEELEKTRLATKEASRFDTLSGGKVAPGMP